MKRSLTKIKKLTRIPLVGKTEVSSAELQLTRDSQLKATNCRWGGSNTSAIPFYEQGQFRAFSCLKKPDKNSFAKRNRLMGSLVASVLSKSLRTIHYQPKPPDYIDDRGRNNRYLPFPRLLPPSSKPHQLCH